MLTSCLTGLDQSALQIKTKIVSCDTADSKPVKQEVNGTMILPPLVCPDQTNPKIYHTQTLFSFNIECRSAECRSSECRSALATKFVNVNGP